MELIIFALLCGALIFCVATGIPLALALLFGLALFCGYGLRRGLSASCLGQAAGQGVKTVGHILVTFVFTGTLTATWRACGAIAWVVYYASGLANAALMLPLAFLLCALVSFLTGSSFATAATMGVIVVTMATSYGISPVLSGGAMLAGAYFGDRCSPVSTSALLVATITQTDLHDNLRAMVPRAALPFALSLALYAALGAVSGGAGASSQAVRSVLARGYDLSAWTLAPIAAVLILSALRVDVTLTLAVSSCLGLAVAAGVQGLALSDLPALLWRGFAPADPDLAAIMAGGGILSMASVFFIVLVASTYSGIFRVTGLLEGIQSWVDRLARAVTPFGAAIVASIATAAVSCNQSLAIMLTRDLLAPQVAGKTQLAMILTDTAVILPALIPWAIAGAVPLDTVGAPRLAMAFAFYLWLIPLWQELVSLRERKKGRDS